MYRDEMRWDEMRIMICGSTRNTDHQREKSTFHALYPIISIREEKNFLSRQYQSMQPRAKLHSNMKTNCTQTQTPVLCISHLWWSDADQKLKRTIFSRAQPRNNKCAYGASLSLQSSFSHSHSLQSSFSFLTFFLTCFIFLYRWSRWHEWNEMKWSEATRHPCYSLLVHPTTPLPFCVSIIQSHFPFLPLSSPPLFITIFYHLIHYLPHPFSPLPPHHHYPLPPLITSHSQSTLNHITPHRITGNNVEEQGAEVLHRYGVLRNTHSRSHPQKR